MAQAYVLGVDVGTGGSRALIIDERGRVVSSATEDHEPFVSPQIGWAEQHPQDWWRATSFAIRKALQSAKCGGGRVACVGFSGQMHGAVMLDDVDEVVRPALIWCDVRSEKQCEDLNKKLGSERIIQLTCNPALPNFTLTKFLWTRENEPENWKRVRSVMLPKDYVRFRLSGKRAIDVADASGTLMLDVARRQWSDEILEAVQIDHSILPTLFESPDICGAGITRGSRRHGTYTRHSDSRRSWRPGRRCRGNGHCRSRYC